MKNIAFLTSCLLGTLTIHWGSSAHAQTNRPPVPIVSIVGEFSFPPYYFYDPYGYSHFVLSPNGSNAWVTFDGSASYDPDGDPLQFVWAHSDEGHLFEFPCLGTPPYCTVYSPLGELADGPLALQVYDGTTSALRYFQVYVYNVEQLILFLSDFDELEEDGVRFSAKQSLLTSLGKALESYRAGQFGDTALALKIYQHKIRAQKRALPAGLADALIGIAQRVINVVQKLE
jgi:hypothetical protein